MTDGHAAFVGSVPANYDRFLGPLLFHPYADDLTARLPVSDGMRVLEVACGTGIVSERLARRLAGRGTLMCTDLNAAMIEEARRRSEAPIEWRTADGLRRPARAVVPSRAAWPAAVEQQSWPAARRS